MPENKTNLCKNQYNYVLCFLLLLQELIRCVPSAVDRIIGTFSLEKVLKILESDHKCNSVKPTTKSCP